MARLTTFGGIVLPYMSGQRTARVQTQQAYTESESMDGVHLTQGYRRLPLGEATISGVFRIDKTYCQRITVGGSHPPATNAGIETAKNYFADMVLAADPAWLVEDLTNEGGDVLDSSGTVIDTREMKATVTEWEVTKIGSAIQEITVTWLVMSGLCKELPSGKWVVLR